MRVVHIIKTSGLAGAERHLIDLMAGQRAHAVDAHLLLLDTPQGSAAPVAEAAAARGIPVAQVTIYGHRDPALLLRLRAALAALRPQIAHAHLIHAYLYGIPAARLARVPVVVASHHDDDPRRRRRALRTVSAGLWRMVDAGIAISEAVRRFVIEVEAAPPDKVHTIHYGLPLPVAEVDKPAVRRALRAELALPPDTPLVGMVCRLMDAKGLPDALAAFAQIAPAFPDVAFVIAGDGPLRESLQAQAQATGIAPRVHFLGWRDDPLAVIAALDLLLMPSTREGFGLTLLEAMSQRVAIIGSTASAIPEVIAHGETGLTVPPRDPDALAAAMRTLLADAALRQHYGLMGEDRLETHFSAARMVDETLALYQRLLARRGIAAAAGRP